jgi:uncharacterized protein YndB with AHSA1/START domain
MSEKITVSVSLQAPQQKVWDYYTLPEHITQWNFAAPSWHCPSASNDLRIGVNTSRGWKRKTVASGSILKLVTQKCTLAIRLPMPSAIV